MPELLKRLIDLLALSAVAAIVAASPAQAAPPVVVHDPSPTALVIRFVERAGEMASDEGRSLEIWGDGRIVVRRPEHALGSRHAESRLPPSAIEALLQALARHGVLDFDPAAAASVLDAAREERLEQARRDPAVTLEAQSDPAPTTLEVRVSRYEPEGPGGPAYLDVTKIIDWSGLRGDAQAHPELIALGGLLAAQDEIAILFASEGLR